MSTTLRIDAPTQKGEYRVSISYQWSRWDGKNGIVLLSLNDMRIKVR